MSNVSFHTVSSTHRGSTLDMSCFLRAGSRETLVYLHGLGSTKYDFWAAIDAVGLNDFTLFAFDFPGSGNSSYHDHLALEIDDLVVITAKVLASFDFMNVTLIGHSMGGLTALRFAEKYPGKVKRFINVEGNITPEDCGVFSRRTAQLTWGESVQDFMKTLQAEFGSLPYLGARLFADKFLHSVTPRAFYDYCVSIVKLSDSRTLMPAFSSLSIPRLFMHGDANNHLPYLSQLGNYGIEVVEVPFSHHWPHHDNPHLFCQTVSDFIART